MTYFGIFFDIHLNKIVLKKNFNYCFFERRIKKIFKNYKNKTVV
jgi:hypothetical protein